MLRCNCITCRWHSIKAVWVKLLISTLKRQSLTSLKIMAKKKVSQLMVSIAKEASPKCKLDHKVSTAKEVLRNSRYGPSNRNLKTDLEAELQTNLQAATATFFQK